MYASPRNSSAVLSTERSGDKSYIVRNEIVRDLTEEEFDLLQPHLELMSFGQGEIIQQIDAPIDHVYFVESGIVSLLVRNAVDAPVEITPVYPSGMIGLEVMANAAKAIYRAAVQVPETSVLRLPTRELQRALEQRPAIIRVLRDYAQLQMRSSAQNLLCQAKHSIEPRLAKWLALASDQYTDGLIPIKQDDLAISLGVRRPSISWAVKRLVSRGLVERRRGAVQIRDMAGLQTQACSCVSALRRFHTKPAGRAHNVHILAGLRADGGEQNLGA